MKRICSILAIVVLVFAFSVTAFAYTSSNTFYTSNQDHNSDYSSGEEYLRNMYNTGSGFPGDECAVEGWSENYNGKYAYAYVYLTDEDGENYSASGGNANGSRVYTTKWGNDDYAQYGKIQCKLYSGSTSSSTLTDYMYMYVYNSDN